MRSHFVALLAVLVPVLVVHPAHAQFNESTTAVTTTSNPLPNPSTGPDIGMFYSIWFNHHNGINHGDCNGNAWFQWDLNQQWRYELLSNGARYIQSLHYGKCLEVAGASQADGQPLVMWTCSGLANQMWWLANDAGYAKYQAAHSGKVMTLSGTASQSLIVQQPWGASGTITQQWSPQIVSDHFLLRSVQTQQCVEVQGDSENDNALVQQAPCRGKSPFGTDSSPGYPGATRSELFSAAPGPASNGCYRSGVYAARQHFHYLKDMNVDFVIFDETNHSKGIAPSVNTVFQRGLETSRGFYQESQAYPNNRIRSAFMLSLVEPWVVATTDPKKGKEKFVWNQHIQDHVQAIYNEYRASPNAFYTVNGKPLLLFYVTNGTNVVDGNNSFAFQGPGNYRPLSSQYDAPIWDGVGTQSLHDLFTIRYAAYANAGPINYSDSAVWPFQTDQPATGSTSTSTYVEAAYASPFVKLNTLPRSSNQLTTMINAGASKPRVLIRTWNEFGIGDEEKDGNGERAYTIEPNTTLTLDNGVNAGKWSVYNRARQTLTGLYKYEIRPTFSNKCADVAGASLSHGAYVHQWDCLGAANQKWRLARLPSGKYHVVASHSGKCMAVENASTADQANIQQHDCYENLNWMLWDVVPSGSAFNLVNVNSGKCLDVRWTSTPYANATPFQQYTCMGSGQINQQFAITAVN